MAEYFNSVGTEFVFTELQTGMTFASLALAAQPYERDKRERGTQNARKAYDAALKFRERVSLSEEQNSRYEAEKQQLKTALHDLGQSV